MNIATMKERIVFQSKNVDRWEDEHVSNATMKFVSGGEEVSAGQIVSQSLVTFAVHKVSALDTMTTMWRIRRAKYGETYNIRRILPDTANATVLIFCEGGKK